MLTRPWYIDIWWITLGCAPAVSVTVLLTTATVGAHSIVVHEASPPPPPSSSSLRLPITSPSSTHFNNPSKSSHIERTASAVGPTRQRTNALNRRRRQQQRKPYTCITGTHWTTNLVFTSCENTPSFVKLEGVRKWTLKGQPLGETSYYGGCCRLAHGENAYIILANGYGPAIHGHALRVDYATTNCTQPAIPFPTRLEITSTQGLQSRCGSNRFYFYGLECSTQLAFSTLGVVDVRRCPSVLAVRPLRRSGSFWDEQLRGLSLDILVCLALVMLLFMEIIPGQAFRYPIGTWRRVSAFPSTFRLHRWVKRNLASLFSSETEHQKKPSEAAANRTWTVPFPCSHTVLLAPIPFRLRRTMSFPSLQFPTSSTHNVSQITDNPTHGTYESHNLPPVTLPVTDYIEVIAEHAPIIYRQDANAVQAMLLQAALERDHNRQHDRNRC
ncbi:rhUS29 [macacine betaherpesvirus 3]|uniref:RhUS29 n=1 Tax=Rhesus cytomegalovirus (strain 68-1) TaxID=47929 RepID=Q2FA76_RHCM6|nr:rhUS29 [macacine betaherpesvirus 3]QXV50547.1 membrane protein US29 [macacine betaherpesvirus 3]